jgi:hypothetical protein
MASYSYKLKEYSDLCHFIPPSEKEHGIQCVFLRNPNSVKDYSPLHYTAVKSLFENRSQLIKEVAFLHITTPGKAFEKFDQEKYKLVIAAKAWPLVQKRMESDYQDMKEKQEWIALSPSISFRGPADIIYKSTLDSTNTFALELVVTKRIDTGKTNITLAYTDETLGSVSLPPAPMMHLAKENAFFSSVWDYKEAVITKRSRQS